MSESKVSASEFKAKYGPWAVVAGASDGTGEEFARQIAAAGVNVVLVARRKEQLEKVAAGLGVDTRIVVQDLSDPEAAAAIAAATSDLEVGLFVYNAGANTANGYFVDADLEAMLAMVQRNCGTVVGLCHHFGKGLVSRGRGGVILVGSWSGLNGASRTAAYSATKSFDMVLAESLWAEWRRHGVDALALVLGATNTPNLQSLLAEHGGEFPDLAEPVDVVAAGLANLANGPTLIYGAEDPAGPSPFGGLSRRQAIEVLSAGSDQMFSD